MPDSPAFPPSDVFTLAELAHATGTSREQLEAWAEAGAIRTLPIGDRLTWVSNVEALRVGRAIRAGAFSLDTGVAGAVTPPIPTSVSVPQHWRLHRPLAVSSSLHAGALGAAILMATLGVGQAAGPAASAGAAPEPLRLVYLALPGPGGGGGGSGAREAARPVRAERKGVQRISSPVAARRPPELPDPVEIPPPQAVPEPVPVEAPVAASPADDQDADGVIEAHADDRDSQGPGSGGEAGAGAGAGLGDGTGPGIGEGSGGGTGGGPYRPGSGISPPALLREVKPDYTDEARRSGIEGDVLLEVVVLSDGSVGNVRVLEGLGYGLDRRAVEAVRQWRFAPARLQGAPVDVLVEVAMAFKLR